jgi:hypothetical protein
MTPFSGRTEKVTSIHVFVIINVFVIILFDNIHWRPRLRLPQKETKCPKQKERDFLSSSSSYDFNDRHEERVRESGDHKE